MGCCPSPLPAPGKLSIRPPQSKNCLSVPVLKSTATVERSFLSLPLLKTYLRNRTTEDRLNGLAMMYILQCVIILVTGCNYTISFPEPAIPWKGNGGSGIIRDRLTKNCMSPVLRMRCK